VVLQRGADPNFYQVGPVYTPFASGSMLLTVVPQLQAQAGDIYKFQWIANCVTTALAPVSFDLGLLGVPNQGVQPVSTYLSIVNS
jgi:hypothetical protein